MSRRIFFSILFSLLAYSLPFAQTSYKSLMHEGNKKFDRGDFSGASGDFSSVTKENPKDFAGHYNLGNSLYKEGKFEEAEQEFSKALALASSKKEKMAAHYNLGNALIKGGDFQKAADEYKKALRIDAYNEQARRNYEIAMLKEKEKEQNQSGGQGGGGENPQEGNEKDPNGKSQDGGSSPGGTQGGAGSNPGEDNKAPVGPSMPKEKQKALLNRVEGRESETARRILNKNTFSVPQSNAKDW